jgi:signal transduction histidine kinase/phage shock protein PspC (stress-responsive transcriptional regulator)
VVDGLEESQRSTTPLRKQGRTSQDARPQTPGAAAEANGRTREFPQEAPGNPPPPPPAGGGGCAGAPFFGRERLDRWIGPGWEQRWGFDRRGWPNGGGQGPAGSSGPVRPAWHRGPLRRQQEGRLAGGVAAGLSARTGMGVNLIRAVFVITSIFGGFGIAIYVLAWLFIPAAGEKGNIASRAMSDGRGIAMAAGAASLLAVLLLLASLLNIGWLGSLSWPPVVALAGLVLIWRNASPEETMRLRRVADALAGAAEGGGKRLRLRVVVAIVLVIAGVGLLIHGHVTGALLRPLSGVALLLAAIIALLGPWWLRIVRGNMADRQARIRAEERAEVATRVHDSVLQTLALIQRRADDPQKVISLARAQERELRSWLFGGRTPGSMDGRASTVADGVRVIQQEVEAQHGVVVEAISVGDCPLDDSLGALLAAAREATVNAAKWSGASTVSLFAEVEPETVSVFVRDRGRGFDPASVPADRKGLAESIRARIARRGGTATIRSAPGEGTEVALTMPRRAGPGQGGGPPVPPEEAQSEPSQAT